MPNATIYLIDLPGSGLLHQTKCPANISDMIPIMREPLKANIEKTREEISSWQLRLEAWWLPNGARNIQKILMP
jgi:hypothetical protein